MGHLMKREGLGKVYLERIVPTSWKVPTTKDVLDCNASSKLSMKHDSSPMKARDDLSKLEINVIPHLFSWKFVVFPIKKQCYSLNFQMN